jgi:hypothetical protein
MPTLISISADGAGRFVGIDHEGQIWRGQVKHERSDGEYIDWRTCEAAHRPSSFIPRLNPGPSRVDRQED